MIGMAITVGSSYGSMNDDTPSVPSGAILDENGVPILDENGNYILEE